MNKKVNAGLFRDVGIPKVILPCLSHEEPLIETYFSQSAFTKLIMYPTLAPQLVPAALHNSLGIRTETQQTSERQTSRVVLNN